MNKVQEKRLLNVARALREAAAAKKKFTMEKWVFGDAASLSRLLTHDEKGTYVKACNLEAEFCGTPACALGHYAARTDLQRILKVSTLKSDDGIKFASLDCFGAKAGSGIDFCDNRVVTHFGITNDEYLELFDCDGCGCATTALQAAKYIERFVKRKQRLSRSTTTY